MPKYLKIIGWIFVMPLVLVLLFAGGLWIYHKCDPKGYCSNIEEPLLVWQIENIIDELKSVNPEWNIGNIDAERIRTYCLSPLFRSKIKITKHKSFLITGLRLSGKIHDISPLKKMWLEEFHLSNAEIDDLSPLEGKKLKSLSLYFVKIRDFSQLQKISIDNLILIGSNFDDFASLRGMSFKHLCLYGSGFEELTVQDLKEKYDIEVECLGFEEIIKNRGSE